MSGWPGGLLGAKRRIPRRLSAADQPAQIVPRGIATLGKEPHVKNLGTLVRVLLDVALIGLGVDFVVTGIRGYCPLYKRLGWNTAGRRPAVRRDWPCDT